MFCVLAGKGAAAAVLFVADMLGTIPVWLGYYLNIDSIIFRRRGDSGVCLVICTQYSSTLKVVKALQRHSRSHRPNWIRSNGNDHGDLVGCGILFHLLFVSGTGVPSYLHLSTLG